ncbi:MAG: hypothetical protein KGL39_27380 [Patescibacteria group bacterium]|nr:hypothetical protein [Patescibacteria group bacterium]
MSATDTERPDKPVVIRLTREFQDLLDEWAHSIPGAEGNRTRALRLFLRAWKAEQPKPRKVR